MLSSPAWPPRTTRRAIVATLLWAAAATLGPAAQPPARAAAPVGTPTRFPTRFPARFPARFVVETDCPPAQRDFLERRLAPFASAADVLVGALTGASPPPRPVRLRVFCQRARYAAFAHAHAPGRAGNGGYFDAASRTVVTYRRGNPPQVLLHEVAHALLRDAWAGASPAPPWLDEGLAEYLSSYAVEPTGVRFGAANAARLATLLDARVHGPWVSVSALVAAPPTAFTGPTMGRYYAAAWGLVDLLVGDPALRARLPSLVAALRAGQASVEALATTYGADARADLDHRLRARVASYAARWPAEAPALALSAVPLGEWTEHGAGRWTASGGPANCGPASHDLDGTGQTPWDDTLTGESPEAWSYLTRAVAPRRAVVFTAEVRRDAGAIGLALGSHRARGYAYHTLVEVRPAAISVLHAASRQSVEPLAHAPVVTASGVWVTLRVEVAGGTVAVWRDGALALTARLPADVAPPGDGPGGPWVSLVGVYVREGRGAFRDLHLGPGASTPPGGVALGPGVRSHAPEAAPLSARTSGPMSGPRSGAGDRAAEHRGAAGPGDDAPASLEETP